MKKNLFAWFMALMIFTVSTYGAEPATTAAATKSLEQLATEVKSLLVKEKIHNRFDLLRRLQEQGLTWQPAILAPNDLVGKLDYEQLRFYAGVKLCDALYAATFMQRQAVADAVQTLEAINERLNLRAYADVSGKFFATLKKAAAEPESVNVQPLLDQLATDYVQDIPALMANPESAEYLIDALYGFTIENGYLLGHFYRNDAKGEGKVMKAVPQQTGSITEWFETIVKLFNAYGRADETIRVDDKMIKKLSLINEVLAVHHKKDLTPESLRKDRESVYAQAAAIRAAMLTPSVQSPPAK